MRAFNDHEFGCEAAAGRPGVCDCDREPDFLIAEESHPLTKEGVERMLRYFAKSLTAEPSSKPSDFTQMTGRLRGLAAPGGK